MKQAVCKGCGAAIVWIGTPSGKSMPCDATPRYYIEKPRSGTKKIVTPNGEVISCEYTEDPHKATGTGFAPHTTAKNGSGMRERYAKEAVDGTPDKEKRKSHCFPL